MKIALLGYGKMGKEIESLATEKGHEIVLKISSTNTDTLTLETIRNADVAIEFSRPETALQNIQLCLKANIPVVVGTTGWYTHRQQIKEECSAKNGSVIFASNFSIGVNLFFLANEYLAKLMANQHQYSASIEEIHHLQKLDKPSGTAITLAEAIMHENSKFDQWSLLPGNGNLVINAVRQEGVTGTHSVCYQSPTDVLELKHTALSRKGFAMGAIIAASWIISRNGFFEFKEIFKEQL